MADVFTSSQYFQQSDVLRVQGGQIVQGTVQVSGAKNAILPMIAASLLTDQSVFLDRCPLIMDSIKMLALFQAVGGQVKSDTHAYLQLNAAYLKSEVAPDVELAQSIRTSILLLGPLLARGTAVSLPLPGGCAIGARPIDSHLQGLHMMSAEIEYRDDQLHARVQGRLSAAHITFDTVTVTGTEHLMMAASLADGETRLDNAACEPEVVCLGNYLNAMGAQICGHGTKQIVIRGVDRLAGCSFQVMPDRIEAATYLFAAAATRGAVRVEGIQPELLKNELLILKEAQAEIACGTDWIALNMHGQRPRAVHCITAPYPGISTDVQALCMVLNAVAEGSGTIKETIFEDRFKHVDELKCMGANISVQGQTAQSIGGTLTGTDVKATDLRAAACLIIAALAAKGQTQITDIAQIDRGYECIEQKFSQLGIYLERISNGRE